MADCDASATLILRDGRPVAVRLLRSSDVDPFATFLAGLSERTRGFYGPHRFDRATAERLCAELDPTRTRRYVAVLDDGTPAAEIIGYMILTREISAGDVARYAAHGPALHLGRCAAFAPSIADAYQEQGLGTEMARLVLRRAAALGLSQVILMGGVQARNGRARRLYERLGFRRVGTFEVTRDGQRIDNLDMILDTTWDYARR
jgi:RimJ/RimL family protein N-acetyltransferase